MGALSGFAVAVLLISVWICLRRRMASIFHTGCRRDPRLEKKEGSAEKNQEFRQRYADLSLQDRNERDRRIAAALVKKWRRKGLP